MKHQDLHDIATETDCMKVYEEVINFVYFNVDIIGYFELNTHNSKLSKQYWLEVYLFFFMATRGYNFNILNNINRV